MGHLQSVGRKSKRKVRVVSGKDAREDRFVGIDGETIDSQHTLISMLLPPAVKAFYADLEAEVAALCGQRYARGTANQRWGQQPGSIVLGRQRVAISKLRVRSRATGKEVGLTRYEQFQNPAHFDEAVFRDGIRHVSQRDYEQGGAQLAASFGLSKSAVSRRWVNCTRKQLETMQTRRLEELNIVAVFIDGKRFSKQGAVVALGIGCDGKKTPLGIYQSSTENSAACLALLESLEQRGLPKENLLFIVDGGSGLNKALNRKYDINDPDKRRAVRGRCYIHKWNNIRDVLDETGREEAAPLYWALRDAPSLAMAETCSSALEGCLKKHNLSALTSYREAKEDLMTIHRLKMNSILRKFFSTTNAVESLNSLTEEDLRRVKRWRNSDHFQRWLATSCLRNEKRMRKIRGHSGLAALAVRLQEQCIHMQKEAIDSQMEAA